MVLGEFVEELEGLLTLVLTQRLVGVADLGEEAHNATDYHGGTPLTQASLILGRGLLKGISHDIRTTPL